MIRKHGNPIRGVRGAKPRLPGNGKAASKEEFSELSREYLETRNRQMHAKAFMAETMAAERRGELIAKDLVEKQAAFLLVSLRQKILMIPQSYARSILGLTEVNQASKILRLSVSPRPRLASKSDFGATQRTPIKQHLDFHCDQTFAFDTTLKLKGDGRSFVSSPAGPANM
jgi:hypothetical protein